MTRAEKKRLTAIRKEFAELKGAGCIPVLTSFEEYLKNMPGEFKVSDIVNLTSKRFGYSDPEKKWIVTYVGHDFIELSEDDSLKIELTPPRGLANLRIHDCFLPDVNIKKV